MPKHLIKADHPQFEAKKSQAKRLFMEYTAPGKISDMTGLSYHTIKDWIRKGSPSWKQERDLLQVELINAASEGKKSMFLNIGQHSIKVMERALEDLSKRETPPTVKEAKAASEIITNLDKILRLDEGKPTDILEEVKPASIIELRKKLASDPFLELEDAEYKEVASVDSAYPDSNEHDGNGSSERTEEAE